MKKPFDILGKLFIVFLIVLWLAPLIWLVITSLKSENTVMSDTLSLVFTPTLENYRKAFASTLLGRWMLNSLTVAVVTTILTVLIDSAMAYVLARIPFRGRKALFIFILAGMMIPFEVLIIQLYLEFTTLGLANTLAAVILPRLALPIGVFILTQFFRSIPLVLEEAAFIDGASRFTVFRTIILPLSKSAVFAVAIIAFINAWNDFLWPLVAISSSEKYTITVGIANFQGTHGTEYSLIMAGALLASVPQIIMYLLFRKNIVKSIAMTGIKE
jgi:multiple sugar transport system permease protein/raffinose/stachyose/melibiose transport system permease protein